jgi:hypothetical protein
MYEADRIECVAESIRYVALTILAALEDDPERYRLFLHGFAALAEAFGDATDRHLRARAN